MNNKIYRHNIFVYIHILHVVTLTVDSESIQRFIFLQTFTLSKQEVITNLVFDLESVD